MGAPAAPFSNEAGEREDECVGADRFALTGQPRGIDPQTEVGDHGRVSTDPVAGRRSIKSPSTTSAASTSCCSPSRRSIT